MISKRQILQPTTSPKIPLNKKPKQQQQTQNQNKINKKIPRTTTKPKSESKNRKTNVCILYAGKLISNRSE